MKELEKRWYYYKAKHTLIYINAFAFAVMLSLGSYYAYTQVDVIKNLFNKNRLVAKSGSEHTDMREEDKIVKKPIEELIQTAQLSNVVVASKSESFENSEQYEVSLEPVIPIIDMERVSHKTSSKRVYRASHHSKKTQRKMVKAKASTYLTASEVSNTKPKVKIEIKNTTDDTSLNSENIKKIDLHGSSTNYIAKMKHKFSISKNPRDALLLAKSFYANRNYKKSEEWALTANKLDSSKDESWHLFAKSKVKLGQKNEALRILSSYYKKSHSSQTKALMLKIQSDRL